MLGLGKCRAGPRVDQTLTLDSFSQAEQFLDKARHSIARAERVVKRAVKVCHPSGTAIPFVISFDLSDFRNEKL